MTYDSAKAATRLLRFAYLPAWWSHKTCDEVRSALMPRIARALKRAYAAGFEAGRKEP